MWLFVCVFFFCGLKKAFAAKRQQIPSEKGLGFWLPNLLAKAVSIPNDASHGVESHGSVGSRTPKKPMMDSHGTSIYLPSFNESLVDVEGMRVGNLEKKSSHGSGNPTKTPEWHRFCFLFPSWDLRLAMVVGTSSNNIFAQMVVNYSRWFVQQTKVMRGETALEIRNSKKGTWMSQEVRING